MVYVIKFIYGFFLPPGLFITLLILLSIWTYKRDRMIAKVTALLALLLYVLTIPVTGILLAQSLESRYQPPTTINGDVIVMLGAGATSDTPDTNGLGQLSGSGANRLLTSYRLYEKTGLPILISGGHVFSDSGVEADIAKRQLMELGVPADKIIAENKSVNTKQNAEFTKVLLEQHGLKKPVLVASALQMERAVRNFEKVNVSVEPYPADYLVNQKLILYGNQFSPSTDSLAFRAIKEYVGIFSVRF
ncbi:YdcF family protein [Ectobacillus sp. sgz5001026]|uniref:YdcF family protein n=1 Tax=Ectobacillus sp. sgz5001026 TaxID=3242473 RepID=UPI0036D26121